MTHGGRWSQHFDIGYVSLLIGVLEPNALILGMLPLTELDSDSIMKTRRVFTVEQQVKGINVKWSKEQASRLHHEFNVVMFGILCFMIGCVCALFLSHVQIAKELKSRSIQMENDLNQCADMVHEYISDRQTIMKQFADMEARFTRMEHLMHIPRAQRMGAWREMTNGQE